MTTIDAGKDEPLLLKDAIDTDQKDTDKQQKQEPALKPIPESQKLMDLKIPAAKSVDNPEDNQAKELDKLNQVWVTVAGVVKVCW